MPLLQLLGTNWKHMSDELFGDSNLSKLRISTIFLSRIGWNGTGYLIAVSCSWNRLGR